jgi:DNA invertase Pin-like site-specific DNA recombinase
MKSSWSVDGSGSRLPKLIGYARVSTSEQSTDMQRDELTKHGCEIVYTDDGLSGATTNRPALKQTLESLQKGDTLVVWRLDRLARSLADLIAMLDGLKSRGVEFRSLHEAIDTKTAAGRLMWQMIGAFAEFERQIIRERVIAGQARAKAAGVKFGRKRILTERQELELLRMANEQRSYKYMQEILGVGRTTVVQTLRRLRHP